MQSPIPVAGSSVWIRRTRWRVEAARIERGVLRVDVTDRGKGCTFLAPFDRVESAAGRARVRHIRPQQALARLAGLVRQSADSRRLPGAVDAAADLLPHQLEPALAILHGARRVLIADDVGLGKTIQAGFVLAELRRRRPALRALVLVPSSLRTQWNEELRCRFRICPMTAGATELQHLMRSSSRGNEPWTRSGVWLASPDFLKQPHVFEALPLQPWDLVVFDEAHALCGDSGRHAVASELARRARCVLLLTATPHTGDDAKFNRLVNLGALACAGDELTTFRRTRRDINRPGVRHVRWQMVTLSREEARLMDALADYEAAVLRAAGAARRPGALLLLSVFRKRALSTCGALCSSLSRRLAWLHRGDASMDSTWAQPPLRWDEDTCESDADDDVRLHSDIGMSAGQETSWLNRLRILALTAARHESKLRRLDALVARSREPVVIFTEFRDSLALVAERLAVAGPVSALHGGLTGDEQQREIRRFLGHATSVLIATDVASQGLNLQGRARWVVNLELPWSPARLEQRAGRVDRIGQRRDVHITMLVARHHAESGLLATLARKTLSAQRVFGADTLQSLAPDERQLQACLIGGEPFHVSGAPMATVRFSRAWRRPAGRLAQSLAQSRRLAVRWRGPATGSDVAFVASSHKVLRHVVEDGADVAFFAVPLVDRSGALVERHVVAIKVPGQAGIAAAAGVAARLASARAARLQRFRQAQLALVVGREYAIAAVLGTAPLNEVQPGLFEQRALRDSARLARRQIEIRDELDRSVLAAESAASISAGTPFLVLRLTSR